MIRTRAKGKPPAELVRNRASWTRRFQVRKSKEWATRRAKIILRAALGPLCWGKCAYCESRLDASDYLQIEHYHCKTLYPDQSFEWANLLPACSICNNSKGEHDHQGTQIKPDAEDPEQYFSVHPDTGAIEPAPGLDPLSLHRAEETIRLFGLQRAPLMTSRKERLEELGTGLLRWEMHGIDPYEWERWSRPEYEYKLVIRSFLALRGYPQLAEADRKAFHSGEA